MTSTRACLVLGLLGAMLVMVSADINCSHPVSQNPADRDPITLSCRVTDVHEFPSDFPGYQPEEVQEISVTGSSIPVLGLTPLLEGLTQLRDLYMSSDGIRFIVDNAFSSLSALRKLILVNNTIAGLSSETFNQLNNLNFLDLSGNRLYELNDNTFRGSQLMALEQLSLARSHIYKIHTHALNQLPRLQILDLSQNNLTEVPVLSSCIGIQTLHLNDNNLNNLSALYGSGSPFNQLVSLRQLYLQNNHISRITADTFAGLTSLQELYLQHNSLSGLLGHPFSPLFNLQVLDVSQNQIISLEEVAVLLPAIYTLKVHDNPWSCDCSIHWLRDNHIVKEYNPKDHMRCASPAAVRGESLYSDVHMHVFDCHGDHGFHSNTIALAVGLIFAVLVVIIGSFILYKFTSKKRTQRHHGSPSSSSPYSRVIYEGEGNM